MPEFTSPFIGKRPDRQLDFGELIGAIRLGIAAEHEAVHICVARDDASDHPLAE